MSAYASRERNEIKRANDSGLPPVVFVHGPWLLSSSGTGGGISSNSMACNRCPWLSGRPRDGREGSKEPGGLRPEAHQAGHRSLSRSH